MSEVETVDRVENDPAPPASEDRSWVSRRPVLRFLLNRYRAWRPRHRLPFNFWIHMVGIPLAYPVVMVLLCLGMWWWALGAFVLGYFLQWVGHLAEGNDVGGWAAIKRWLGLPYVAISPRWGREDVAP